MTPDLISALGMFAAGLVLGGLFLYSFSRRRLVAAAPDIARLDLEVKRDALLRQLRELDDSNVEEKQRLELEAAAVLRNLEGAPKAASVPRAETRPAVVATAQPSATRGFLWGAGSVAAVALLVWFVANQVKQRGANEGLTGTVPQQQAATSSQQPATDAALQQLEAAVKANPDDLNLRTDLAKAYLDRENLLSVFEQTRVVLAKDPENAKALTYQALVRMSMGQMEEASTMLTKATKSDPTLLDSWVGLAWVQMRAGKSKEAEASIHAAAKIHPEESARLEGVLQEMRQRATQPASTAPTPAAMQPPSAPASGPAVHITVNLEGPPRPGAILFVLARPAGVTSGPPSAVKRLQPESFPITIDLSSADSMLGGALPDKLRIEARLDTDGDATTKDPSEPKAAQDGVSANSTVTLTLR